MVSLSALNFDGRSCRWKTNFLVVHAKTSAKLGIPLQKLVRPPAIEVDYLLNDQVEVVHSAGFHGDCSSPSAMNVNV